METTKGLILAERYHTLLKNNGINTPIRLAYFIGNPHHECNLKPVRESLYYKTIQSLRDTFYSPFKGKSDAFVSQYLRNSEKCANYVYANRNGNGNEASGDGFRFRGGGLTQHTFKNMFKAMTKATGINFLDFPDAVTNEANAMVAYVWYWNENNLNQYADNDDIDGFCDIINIGHKTTRYGDANGFKNRKELIDAYKIAFKN